MRNQAQVISGIYTEMMVTTISTGIASITTWRKTTRGKHSASWLIRFPPRWKKRKRGDEETEARKIRNIPNIHKLHSPLSLGGQGLGLSVLKLVEAVSSTARSGV